MHNVTLFLLEVATYPERRVEDQLTCDLMLVYLDRGREVMLEVPYLGEIVIKKSREAPLATAHENIAAFLEARFGDVPRDLVETIESVVDEKQLKDLVQSAAACPDLAAFRRAMTRG